MTGQTVKSTRNLEYLLFILIAALLVLQLHLQFVQKINWDEFYFLSLIYDHQRGDLTKPLQTAHVHFFGWLKFMSPNEVTQIIAARVVMFALQLGTLYFIYKTAREFMSRSAALFAILSFLGFGFIFIHGTSFRADPIAACFMSAAIYIFGVRKLNIKDLVALALCLALGFLVTIKVVFFAPLFLVLALWRLTKSSDKKALFTKFAATALATAALIFLGYLFQLSQMSGADVSGSKEMLGNAGRTTLFAGELFPRGRIIFQHFLLGLIPTLMVGIGLVFLVMRVLKKSQRLEAWVLIAMGLPLLSLIFYRNAFPYFFAFIFPSAILWAGYGAERLRRLPLLLGSLAVILTGMIGVQYQARLKENMTVQYETLAEMHRLFPNSVNYIDRNSMMASESKSGFFMSSWGIQNYLDKKTPVIQNAMMQTVIPVVIENSLELNRVFIPSETKSLLLQDDQIALRENYVHHWGHIWLAGKTLNVSQEPSEFKNLIPGDYSLMSETPVTLNGARYYNGDLINLPRGIHVMTSLQPQRIDLRWGKDIVPPNTPEPTRPIFSAF